MSQSLRVRKEVGSLNSLNLTQLTGDKVIGTDANGQLSMVEKPKKSIDRILTISNGPNGDYSNFNDALTAAVALNPIQTNPVLIQASPGTYFISNTLTWPAFVDFGTGQPNVTIITTNPNGHILDIQGSCNIDGLVLVGAANANAVNMENPGMIRLTRVIVANCQHGLRASGANILVRVYVSGTSGVSGSFMKSENGAVMEAATTGAFNCQYGYDADGGVIRMTTATADGCTAGINIKNSNSFVMNSQSFNCSRGICVADGGYLEGSEYNAFNCTYDLETLSTISGCKMGSCRFDENKLKIDDESLVSLNINDISGKDKYYGGATVFEIQQIDLFGTALAGASPPMMAVVKNNGQSSASGNSLRLWKNDSVTIPHDASLNFSSSWSMEFWLKPFHNRLQVLVCKQNSFIVYYLNNNIYLFLYDTNDKIAGYAFGNTLISKKKNHVALVVNDTDDSICIFTNNEKVGIGSFKGSLNSNTNDIYVGKYWSNTYYCQAEFEEIKFWSKAMTEAEISTSYNNGLGLASADTVNLMAGYRCDEGSGTTLTDYSGNANNGTHDGSYRNGMVDSSTLASFGVVAYHFSPTDRNELFFNIHPDAGYKDNESIIPVIHWAPSDDVTVGDVVWKFEYTTSQPGSVIGNTTSLTSTSSTDGVAYKHFVTEMTSFSVNNYRTTIMGRIARDGHDADDTYPDDVVLIGFEFKYVKNKLGSDD